MVGFGFPHFVASVAMLAGLSGAAAATGMPCTDVALVLAKDASGSMSDEEFAFQMQATAAALVDPGVLEAIRSVGGIALTTIVWSDSTAGIGRVQWDHVHDAPSAALHGTRILGLSRGAGGNTDMGQGIAAALDLLADPSNCASRRIVNVSGDGRETPQARGRATVSVAAARSRANSEGVTINGLAIEDEDTGLRDWYEARVIAGQGAFAMGVGRMADYGAAIRKKLMREIRGEALAADAIPPAPAAAGLARTAGTNPTSG